MLKKTGIALLLAFVCLGTAYAQLPKGIDVSVDAETNALQLNKTEKSDVDLRKEAGRDIGRTIAYPFGGHNWYGGTNLSLSYNGAFFGGSLSLGVTTSDQKYYDDDRRDWFDLYPVHAGAMNGWLKLFNDSLKISLGRGIASGYADGQGGEALRIYNGGDRDTWDKSRAPDDVVQDEGLLLEGFFGPLSLALAGRYYTPSLYSKSLNPSDPPVTQNTRYASMEQRNFSYGARIGSEMGEWGKLSASYIVEYDNVTGDNYTNIRDGGLVPNNGDAEFTRHLFGVFASLYPLENLGVSIGYNGVFTVYPKQVYGVQELVNITLPLVYQQALNLNLRYTGIRGLTLRTDHNLSFWGDKNFTIFIPSRKDDGLAAESAITRALPTVGHLLMWNGLGLNWAITDTWSADLYVRNLYRHDTADDPEKDIDYSFTRNQIFGELKVFWKPNEAMELYFGLSLEHMFTLISEDVARDTVGSKDGFTVLANAKEIRDTTLILKVPVGIIVRMR